MVVLCGAVAVVNWVAVAGGAGAWQWAAAVGGTLGVLASLREAAVVMHRRKNERNDRGDTGVSRS
ncbi:hypothetical protein [Actinoplanes sp. RD1]|uniref:hypothetical protein n=1 Tax=Actinoplanes sp. RD1 TaxID=3064538 RepID=UPI0027405C78|nr:hypothetical protein [Actinoplanes sp. RD1]